MFWRWSSNLCTKGSLGFTALLPQFPQCRNNKCMPRSLIFNLIDREFQLCCSLDHKCFTSTQALKVLATEQHSRGGISLERRLNDRQSLGYQELEGASFSPQLRLPLLAMGQAFLFLHFPTISCCFSPGPRSKTQGLNDPFLLMQRSFAASSSTSTQHKHCVSFLAVPLTSCTLNRTARSVLPP